MSGTQLAGDIMQRLMFHEARKSLIMNIKVKLRALRKAEVEVYNKASSTAFEQFKSKLSNGACAALGNKFTVDLCIF